MSKDKEPGFDKLEPKPFEALSLKEKLELAGVTVVPVESLQKGLVDPYGISESKDLFLLLAVVANKVVNKDSFLDFNLVQAAFVAYTGAKQIPKELTHLTETELTEIQQLVEGALKFDNPDKAKLERLVERIVFAGLIILSGITEYAVKE